MDEGCDFVEYKFSIPENDEDWVSLIDYIKLHKETHKENIRKLVDEGRFNPAGISSQVKKTDPNINPETLSIIVAYLEWCNEKKLN